MRIRSKHADMRHPALFSQCEYGYRFHTLVKAAASRRNLNDSSWSSLLLLTMWPRTGDNPIFIILPSSSLK